MEFDFHKEPGRTLEREPYLEKIIPRVTIITPYYNAGKYFEQTFNCVMNQTFPWFEWIIVNDGSTNAQDVETAEKFSRRDARICLLHKENGGIATARNLAVRHAKTDIIIPLDADDLLEPTYVECLYFGLLWNEDYDWCYTNNVGFHNQQYLWNESFDCERLKKYNFLVYSAAIRKHVLEEIGGYGEDAKHFYEDWHLWLRLVAAGKKPVKCGIYGFWYRRLDTGVLSIVDKNSIIKEKADALIKAAAEQIKQSVQPKSYPLSVQNTNYKKPEHILWEENPCWKHTEDGHNILFLFPWMEMGGADVFNLNMVHMLDKQKYRMCMLTTMEGENPWRQKFEEYVTDIFELPSFLDVEKYISFIDYMLQSRSIDIVFVSNSYYGYYAVPWIRMHYPDIAIVDYVHMEEWYWRGGGYARTSGVMQDFQDRTFTCNERTRQVLIKDFGCREEKVRTVYIGTDTKRFCRLAYEEGGIRKKYGISQDAPVILFPCRLHPQKRPFLMLEIAGRVVSQEPTACFLIVGDGAQRREMEAYAKRAGIAGSLIFAGEQKDMAPFYRDSTAVLICSIQEGLALTAYEAQAMGVPVVSADVGGQKELITKQTGILVAMRQDEKKDLDARTFPEEEIREYADALLRLCRDRELRERLGRNAEKIMNSAFSVKCMAETLEQEFSGLFREEMRTKRRESAQRLQAVAGLAEDSLVIYQELAAAQIQIESTWRERCWFAEENERLRREQEKGPAYYWKLLKWKVRQTKAGDWLWRHIVGRGKTA